MENKLVYVGSDKIEINEVDEKLVILEPTGTEIYVLNEEEKNIFQLFDGVNSVADVEQILIEKYDDNNILEDIREYVKSLVEKGILVGGKL